jgi:hypothetical protein
MRGLGKSLVVLLAACLAGALFLEIAGSLTYRAVRGRIFSRSEIRERLTARRFAEDGTGGAEASKDETPPDQAVVLHPFFGFVINPTAKGVNEFGFFRREPLVKRSPDKRTVIFFGGSVADQVFYLGQPALLEALQQRPDFQGRAIEILTTAVGGYKQPQQLMILAYLLSRGAEYDVVVNLDGFNEIDSSMDNIATGVNPYFPHTWKLHARLGLDREASVLLGRIEVLRDERERLRRWFDRPLLRSAAFSLALWDFLDRAREAEIHRRTAQLEAMLDDEREDLPPQVQGPPYEYENDEAFYRDMADFWASASLHMARLCELHGIAYVHLLQPNQYLPGSKKLTDEELEVAYDDRYTGIERVPVAYPILIERGGELRERHGVNFVDLTRMFADESRTVYNDFCCHVNKLGAELMARRVAAAIPELP